MKRLFSIVLIVICISITGYATDEIYMQIGNNRALCNDEVRFIDATNADVTPIIVDDRTLIPIRFVGELFDCQVDWDEQTKTVTLVNTERMIELVIGKNTMKLEKAGIVKEISLDVPPQLINERTYLPLRLIAVDGMELSIYWDGKSLISIGKSENFDNDAAINAIDKLKSPMFSLKDFPRIDGSTATNPFVIDLAKKLLDVGETSATEATSLSKTHQAYVNLIEGKMDLIFVTKPSEEELNFAKENGVELEVIPFAKEGFVFLTHKNNIVDSLTLEQVKGIYEGKIKNWSELGGVNADIIPYQRPANSGSQTIMQEFMKDSIIIDPPKEQVIMEMGELIDAVANYQNSDKSIGYSVYYFAKEMHENPQTKLLKINEVAPTAETIRSMQYPIVSNYYAVIRKSDDVDAPSRKVLNWVMSIDGQKLVDESGLVSM